MKKNKILVTLTSIFGLLSSVLFIISSCGAQVPCNNICQKIFLYKDCWGAINQSVEFVSIPCDQNCPSDEHVKTECPCTWEMWRQITGIDCDGTTNYTEQKIDDFPCGTTPNPDENITLPCVKPDGQSDFKKYKIHYVIRQNNCVCDEYTDITYQFIDMDCHSHTCRKMVTTEFCDGSIVKAPPAYVEVLCPGTCPPNEVIADSICQYECGLTITYYACDDSAKINYIEPMRIFTYTYNCSNHDIPFCPPDQVLFEDCDMVKFNIYKRKVVREYKLIREECIKAIRISTNYEMIN
jgi:hypothetical protein